MNFIELKTILQNLTNRKIYDTEIAKILNVTSANISKRTKNDSEITVSELQAIENYYGKLIYKSPVYSLERHFIPNIKDKRKNFANRINKIIAKHNLSSAQMAVLLNLSEQEFDNIKNEKSLIDINLLDKLKENFNVSLDWLLYGD